MFFPLQVQQQIVETTVSHEIPGAVAQLTESSIQLAEAAANFGALKLMFGVFISFIFILMLFFIYQMLTYNRKLADIHRSAAKIERYFEDDANKSIGKVQAVALIRRTFTDLSQTIKYHVLRTRLECKPEQEGSVKEHIKSRVTSLVNYETSELVSFLSGFDYNGVVLSEGFAAEDKQLILDFIVEQVFQPSATFTVSGMDQAADILINGVKLSVLKNLR